MTLSLFIHIGNKRRIIIGENTNLFIVVINKWFFLFFNRNIFKKFFYVIDQSLKIDI